MTDTSSDTSPPTDTIDITNLVTSLKTTFINWAVAYIYGLEVAAEPWVGLPIISSIDRMIVKALITYLVNSAIMEAFFLNTAVRKASQAQDYVDAIAAKAALPPTTSQANYQLAEQAEMTAFRNFVMVTN